MIDTDELIRMALKEDLQGQDITTDPLNVGQIGEASIVAKEACLICGVDIVRRIFEIVDKDLKITVINHDGDMICEGDHIIRIEGNIGNILKGERVALNFLQRLSGISTETYNYVRQLEFASVYDTRKTSPLMRNLEKYAVRIGGGKNHRHGLFDQVLVKENHVKMMESLNDVIDFFKRGANKDYFEVEVRNVDEFKIALEKEVPTILLDNFEIEDVKKCLSIIGKFRPIIEVSGNINLDNIKTYDIQGIDRISIGRLTHSIRSIDLSLLVEKVG